MPLKPCEIFGRVEMMFGSGKYCLSCRAEMKNKWSRDYYAAHWKELREKEGGRYSWEVRFKNPLTKRTVLWQSDGDFDSLRNAQKDFSKACGGGR